MDDQVKEALARLQQIARKQGVALWLATDVVVCTVHRAELERILALMDADGDEFYTWYAQYSRSSAPPAPPKARA